MAYNNRYIPFYNITDYFVDKDTGEPLSGGILTFYIDDAGRTTPKEVFQISGTSLNYTYTSLGNEVTLDSVGTPADNLGNPIVIYGYPFDNAGEIERYFITVDSQDLVRQYTVEAAPYIPSDLDPTTSPLVSTENQLSNPQFVDVLFPEAYYSVPESHTYTVTGTMTSAVAPGWDLVTTGTGTVVVTRLAPTQVDIPTQPPYALRIVSSGLSAIRLRQTLLEAPRLDVGAASATPAITTFAAAYVVASSNSGDQPISVVYTKSTGSPQTIIAAQTVPSGGTYTAFSNSTQITTANTDSAISGYVSFDIVLPANTDMVITSAQLSQSNSATIPAFSQMSPDRQRDQLSHYYMPQVQQKPIPSYLIGWDFPLNPYQAAGPTQPVRATGANRSYVAWDQTIIFQSADSSTSYTQTTEGALRITTATVAPATTQFALIQYREASDIRDLLLGRMAVNLAAFTNVASGVDGCIQLFYTTDTALPIARASTYLSIVATLNADGTVATFNNGGGGSGWVEIPRINNLGNANFNIQQQSGLDQRFYDYAFNGWSLEGSVVATTATYFAIVVGTAPLANATNVDFLSIGLMSGDVATRPAPKTKAEVLADCQYYYYKTFLQNIYPDAGAAARISGGNQISASMNLVSGALHTRGFTISYPVMRATFTLGTNMFFYSPATGVEDRILWQIVSNGATSGANTGDFVATTEWLLGSSSNGQAYFVAQATTTANGAGAPGTSDALIRFHYLIDRRLGVFN